MLHGGEQERGRRAGTENVPGIVGLAVALMLAESERKRESERLSWLRDRLIEGVLSDVPGARLTGHPTRRLPGHASFCLDGVTGEAVLVELDQSVKSLRTAHPKPDLQAIFARLDRLANDLPPGTDPALLVM